MVARFIFFVYSAFFSNLFLKRMTDEYNPFKKFIEEAKAAEETQVKSERVNNLARLEASMELFNAAINDQAFAGDAEQTQENIDESSQNQHDYTNAEYYSDPNSNQPYEQLEPQHDQDGWVQYIDDESGYPYWYNEITGEARWASQEIQQAADESAGAPETLVIPETVMGPWEKYYDDEGNPFYYNRDTGQSEWEIPAEMLEITLSQANSIHFDPSGAQQTAFQASTDLSESADAFPARLESEFNETLDSPKVIEHPSTALVQMDSVSRTVSAEGSRSLKISSSFRSIRSARSFGLHSPHKKFEQIALQVGETDGEGKGLKKLKSQLSFTLKKVASVNNMLKPKTPLKSKGKNGFQMLKEGAAVLRQAVDSTDGLIWIEYQSADEGPIFYSSKNSDTGQWTKPPVFSKADIAPTTPKASSGLEEGSMTGSEGSVVEVVDYFSIETDEALKLKSPMEMLSRFITKNPAVTPIINQSAKSLVTFSTDNMEQMQTPNVKTSNISSPIGGDSMQTPSADASSTKPVDNNLNDIGIDVVDDESLAVLQNLRDKLEEAQYEFITSLGSTKLSVASSDSLLNEADNSNSESPTSPLLSFKLPTIHEVSDDASTLLSSHTSATDIISRINSEMRLAPIPSEDPISESNESLDAVGVFNTIEPITMTKETLLSKEKEGKLESNINASILETPSSNEAIVVSPSITEAKGNSNTEDETVNTVGSVDDEQSKWNELCKRSHNIQESSFWICYYDIVTKQRFFHRKSDQHCQFERPLDFDSTIHLLSLNETVDTSKLQSQQAVDEEKPSSKRRKANKADKEMLTKSELSVKGSDSATAVQPASLSSPMKSMNLEDSMGLLTDINHIDSYLAQNPPIAQTFAHSSPAKEVFDGVINVARLLEEPIHLPQESDTTKVPIATELQSFLNNSLHRLSEMDDEQETKQLLQRLSLLKQQTLKPSVMNALLSSHLSTQQYERLKKIEFSKTTASSSNKANSNQQYNSNEILLENCNNLLEQMDISPMEHLINHKLLLQAMLRQRKRMTSIHVTDYWHNHLVYSFGRAFYPYWPTIRNNKNTSYVDPFHTSKFLHTYYMNQLQKSHNSATRHFVLYKSPVSHRSFYMNVTTQTLQLGKPFDLMVKETNWKMKLESWNEYEINLFAQQKTLEQSGVQLLTDPYHGYLFYCPYRQEYSSTGKFLTSTRSNPTDRNEYRDNNKIHYSANLANAINSMQYQIRDNIWEELLSPLHGSLIDEEHEDVKNPHITEIDGSFTFTQQRMLVSRAVHYFQSEIKKLKTKQNTANLSSPWKNKLTSSSSFLTLQVVDEGLEGVDEQQAENEVVIDKEARRHRDDYFSKMTTVLPKTSNELSASSSFSSVLPFEGRMPATSYEQYTQHLVTIYYHMNNLNLSLSFATYHALLQALLELMSFLLRLGLGKPALGILKYTVEIMKALSVQANELMEFTFYELLISQLLMIKLSWRYFHFIYNHTIMNILLEQITATYLPLSVPNTTSGNQQAISKALNGWMNSANALNLTTTTVLPLQPITQQMEYVMFLLTHIACYYKKLQYYEYAEGLLISVLCIQSNYPLACLHYAYLLCSLQHRNFPENTLRSVASNNTSEPSHYYYKQALRYLQRVVDIPNVSSTSSLTTWQRIAKLQILYLQEYLSSSLSLASSVPFSSSSSTTASGNNAPKQDDTILLTSYKSILASSCGKSDSIQSSIFVHIAILAFQQTLQTLLQKKSSTSDYLNPVYPLYDSYLLLKEYMLKSIQADEDNALAHLLLASYSSVMSLDLQYQQITDGTIPINISRSQQALEVNKRPLSSTGRSSSRPTTPTALQTAHRNQLASATNSRPSSANGLRVTNKTITQKFNDTQTTPAAIPSSNGSEGTTTIDPNQVMSSLQIDAYYRRGIILLPLAPSYSWMSMLSYADFQANVLHDQLRAVQYYEQCVKDTFSTEILPILALGQYYHYQCNDYRAVKHLYLRALRSRHPHYDFAPNQFDEFDGFYFATASVSSSKPFAYQIYERTNHFHTLDESIFHELLSMNVSSGSNQAGSGKSNSFAGMNSTKNLYHPQQSNYPAMSSSIPINSYLTISEEYKSDQQYPREPKISAEQSVPEVDSRARECALQQNQDDSTLLYIAIGYYLWDCHHDFSIAIRFALAAYLIAPQYTPAIRLLGLLLYFHVSKKLGVYYLQLCSENSLYLSSAMKTAENPYMMMTYVITKLIKFQYLSSIKLIEKCLSLGQSNSTLHDIPCLSIIHRTLALTYFLSSPCPDATSSVLSGIIDSDDTTTISNNLEKAIYHGYLAYQYSQEQDYEMLRMIGEFYLQLKNYHEAKVYFLKCAALFPYDCVVYCNLAICVHYLHPRKSSTSDQGCAYAKQGRQREPLYEDRLLQVAYSHDSEELFHVAFLLLQWHEEEQLPYGQEQFQHCVKQATSTAKPTNNHSTAADIRSSPVRHGPPTFPTSPNAGMFSPQPKAPRSSNHANNAFSAIGSQGMAKLMHPQYSQKSYQMIACYLYFQYAIYLYQIHSLTSLSLAKDSLLVALSLTQQIAFTTHHQWMTSMILFYLGKVLEESCDDNNDPNKAIAMITMAEQYYVSAIEGHIPSIDINHPITIHYSIHPMILLLLIDSIELKVNQIKLDMNALQQQFGQFSSTHPSAFPYLMSNNHQTNIVSKKGKKKKSDSNNSSSKKMTGKNSKKGGIIKKKKSSSSTIPVIDTQHRLLQPYQEYGWMETRVQENDFYTPKRNSSYLYNQQQDSQQEAFVMGNGTQQPDLSAVQFQSMFSSHQQQWKSAMQRNATKQNELLSMTQLRSTTNAEQNRQQQLQQGTEEDDDEINAYMQQLSPGLQDALHDDELLDEQNDIAMDLKEMNMGNNNRSLHGRNNDVGRRTMENDDEDEEADEDMGGFQDTVIPMETSSQMSVLLKRMMMHQRVLELASLKKFSYQKKYKDMMYYSSSPYNDNTTAAASTESEKKKNNKKKTKSSQSQNDPQVHVPYVFFHVEWLEHSLFAMARCEDWSWLVTE